MKHYQKIEIIGNKVSILQSSNGWASRSTGNPLGRSSKNADKNSQAVNRKRVVSRAIRRYFNLVSANFQGNYKFLTLTFASELYATRHIANPAFKNFIDKLRKGHDKNLRYIATIEHQKRGVIHYHLLIDMAYLSQRKLQNIWGNGIVYIKQIKDDKTGIAEYTGKYLSKELGKNLVKYEENAKLFLRSRNLITKFPCMSTESAIRDNYIEIKNFLHRKQGEGQSSTYFGVNDFLGAYTIETIKYRRNKNWVEVADSLLKELSIVASDEDKTMFLRYQKARMEKLRNYKPMGTLSPISHPPFNSLPAL